MHWVTCKKMFRLKVVVCEKSGHSFEKYLVKGWSKINVDMMMSLEESSGGLHKPFESSAGKLYTKCHGDLASRFPALNFLTILKSAA